MAAKKKSASRSKAHAKVGKVMHEYKQGQLKSGGRAKVKSRKQAIAIGLSEARRAGAARKKSSARKKASRNGAKSMEEARIGRLFLEFSRHKLRELAVRIEVCLDRLSEEQIWIRGTEAENAAGNLVLHLCGNVRQWIIANMGGQPDRRDRGSEFSARGGTSKEALRVRLRTTIEEALVVLDAVGTERLAERRTIQGYDVTLLEAIAHVVEHFSMHTGQIIFLTKLLTGEDLGFYRHLESAAAPGPAAP